MTSYDGSFYGHDHDADSVVYDTRVNNRNAESTAQRRARVMSVMLSVTGSKIYQRCRLGIADGTNF